MYPSFLHTSYPHRPLILAVYLFIQTGIATLAVDIIISRGIADVRPASSSMSFHDPFPSQPSSSRKTSSSDSSDLSSYIRPTAFAGHRDTLARIHFERKSVTQLPVNVLDCVLKHLPFSDYISLRLVCRRWLVYLPQPTFPPSYHVPSEILQQIYLHLLPADFDAARHTCKSWFLASLDKGLQKDMLRRSGCWGAAQADLAQRHEDFEARRLSFYRRSSIEHGSSDILDCHQSSLDDIISEEWLYSKRLSTESLLAADWRGSGLHAVHPEPSSLLNRFQLTDEINFSTQIRGEHSVKQRINSFTVSTCGRFVLLVNYQHVFIYSLREALSSVLVTHLACGRDVLGVSMDTSSSRYAIAVLLEGRVGMCWDLDHPNIPAGEPTSFGLETAAYTSNPEPMAGSLLSDLPPCRAAIHAFGFASGRRWTSNAATEVTSPYSFRPREVSQQGDLPTTVYRNIGSPDDSPRAVALCPQRKCVAFGCKLGIELHWIDALTGSELNRWFPLAAPSDHLFFLPRRAGDSTRKLRLISSARGPSSPTSCRGSTRAVSDSRVKRIDASRRRSLTRLFFGNLPFPSAFDPAPWLTDLQSGHGIEERQGVLRTVDCDHYRAVPLSDGVHVLFTDPESNLVCLGSDAPLGGPTKLLRKAILFPPDPVANPPSSSAEVYPLCYSAGPELSWGVRIVVAYSDGSLVLYNIPSDLFERIRYIRNTPNIWDELAGVVAESDLAMDQILASQGHETQVNPGHPNASTEPQAGNGAMSGRTSPDVPFVNLHVLGVMIAQTDDVKGAIEDVAVDSRLGGVRVWTFGAAGLARLYDLYLRQNQLVRRRWTTADGAIVENDAPRDSSKGKEKAEEDGFTDKKHHIQFAGMDGSCDLDLGSVSRAWRARTFGGRVQIEILTDWRGEELLKPYVVCLE